MSSSDSWTLIGLTILVFLLLFYLSKKMICSPDSSGNSPTHDESGNGGLYNPQYVEQQQQHYPYEVYYDNDNLTGVIHSNGFGNHFDNLDNLDNLGRRHFHHQYHQGINNNSNLVDPIGVSIISSQSPTTFTAPVPVNKNISLNANSRMMMTVARKNMIESKLRTEFVRMVQAEREVQRLANLLSIEQGLGRNGEEYITTFRNNLLHPSHHHQYHQSSRPFATTTASATATITTTGSREGSNTNGSRTRELILSTETLHAQDDHIQSHQEQQLDLDLDQPPPAYDDCVPR